MKKILLFFLLAAILLSFASCGEYTEGIIPPRDSTGESKPIAPGGTGGEGETFSVSLSLLKDGHYENYVPDVPMYAQWTNGYNYYTADFDENGVASVSGLDGDYDVTVYGLPAHLAYNSNVHTASNFNKDIVIDVYEIQKVKTSGGAGNGLYNCIPLSGKAVYSVTLESAKDVVYFQFDPRESGMYSVESWVDVTENKYNPQCDVYTGTFAAKYFAYTLDDGGASGGYTQNFRHEVKIADDEIGNSFTFAIKASSKNGDYPVTVIFALQLDGGFTNNRGAEELVVPYELYEHTYDALRSLQKMSYAAFCTTTGMPESEVTRLAYDELKGSIFPVYNTETGHYSGNHIALYTLFHSGAGGIVKNYLKGLYGNGGYYVGAESDTVGVEGRYVFNGDQYKFWSKAEGGDGFYHLYDEEKYASGSNPGYGPLLYAHVSTPCRFTASFNTIEDAGNKALTVNKTENHKLFFEGFYDLSLDPPSLDLGPYLCVLGCVCRDSGSCVGGCEIDCRNCSEDCRKLSPDAMYGLGYAELSNGDGLYPVTEELKRFLQAFSISQRYFADGNGWVETNETVKVDAKEEDQWLFACVYYPD